MPYRRTYRRRPRRRLARKADMFDSTANVARKAYQGVRAIKRMLNPETKVATFSATGNSSTTASLILSPVNIAQGDGRSNREGNSMKVIGLDIKFHGFLTSAPLTSQFVRLVIIKANQQVPDTAPSWTDFMADGTYDSFLNPDSHSYCQILKDKTYRVEALSNQLYMDNFTLPMQQHIYYNGGTTTDLQKNGIYIFLIGSEVTYPATYTIQAQTRFVDN